MSSFTKGEELLSLVQSTTLPNDLDSPSPSLGLQLLPLDDEEADSIEAARPVSDNETEVPEDLEETALHPWLRSALTLFLVFMRVAWNTFAEILRTIGLGRSPATCVTFRQRLWLFLNCRILEDYTDFTLEPGLARQFQTEMSEDPTQIRTRALLLRCPLLSMVGERPIAWDVCQRLTFLSSNGRFFAERHGTITKDGHLLILHHIVRIPDSVVRRLQPITHVSLFRCAVLSVIKLTKAWLPPAKYACGLRNSLASYAPKAGPASDYEGTSTRLPVSCGSTPGAPSTTVPSSEDAGRWPTDFARSVAPKPPQVALFQHGLLEASNNWLAAAAPVDDDHAWTLENSFVGVRWIWRELEDVCRICRRVLVDMKSPFEGVGPGPRPDASMRQALPFFVVLEGEKAAGRRTVNGTSGQIDVWLTNSRGNCYSRTPPQPDMDDYLPPLGYRSGHLNELLAYAEIFGQNWTYHDMAILDVDAIFERVACLTQNRTWVLPTSGDGDRDVCRPFNEEQRSTATANFRPLCLGFSQGAATLLLYTAFKERLNAFLESRALPPANLSTVSPLHFLLFSPPLALCPHNSSACALLQKDRSVSAAKKSNSSLSSTLRLPSPTYRKSMRLTHDGEHWTVTKTRALVNWLLPVDRMVAFFFYLAKKHLGIVSVVVEALSSLMPNSIYPWIGHFFVREMLQFYTDPLTPASRRWVYPLTPSGLTSHKNMDLYMHRIITSEPLGYRFGSHISWPLAIHSDQEVNRAIEDFFSDRLLHLETIKLSSQVAPIDVWLGRLDNIAWPERSAEVALSEVAETEVERVPLLASLKAVRSAPVQHARRSQKAHLSPAPQRPLPRLPSLNEAAINEESLRARTAEALKAIAQEKAGRAAAHKVHVRLMEGLGHLDFVWGSHRCKDVYPVVWKQIEKTLFAL